MTDIFGQALAGYRAGDRETPLIVWRDDGHGDAQGPAMWFADRLWRVEAAVAEHVAGRVLDIGCGAGRHLLHFQRLGHEITGIDASPLAVGICRARGCENVVQGDVLTGPLPPGSFDTALLFGNNIGIGGTPDGIRAMLTRLRGVVRGKVLLTTVDVTGTRNPKHRDYIERNRVLRRSPGAMRIRLEYGEDSGDWFDWLHPHPGELRELAAASGWEVADLLPFPQGAYAAVLRQSPVH